MGTGASRDSLIDLETSQISALRDALLAQHAHLVRRIAQHLFRRRAYVDVQDLIKVGMLGLEEAMQEYRPNAVYDFEAFASTFIRRAMLQFVRRANWSAR
jgi:RNA polymerase sigma factor FliA